MTMENIRKSVYEFTLATKLSSYRIFEYSGIVCKKCLRPTSIRVYFDLSEKFVRMGNEVHGNIMSERKRTICCGCGVKVVLKNGLVFNNKDRHNDFSTGKRIDRSSNGLTDSLHRQNDDNLSNDSRFREEIHPNSPQSAKG